jgi:hypothetical protein
MSQPPLNDDLRSLEARLKRLAPAVAPGRDRILYEAGRAAAPRGWAAWPLAAVSGALAVLVLFLAALLLTRSGPGMPERVIYVPVPSERADEPPADPEPPAAAVPEPTPAGPPAPLSHYRQVQEQILRWDLEGLPRAAPPPRPPPHESPSMLLRSL